MTTVEVREQRFSGESGEWSVAEVANAAAAPWTRGRSSGSPPVVPEVPAAREEAGRETGRLAIPLSPILSVIRRVRARQSGLERVPRSEHPFDHFLKIPVIQPGQRLDLHNRPGVVATVFERDQRTGVWSPAQEGDESIGTMAYSPEHDAVVVFDREEESDGGVRLVHWDAHLTEGRLEKPQELKHLQLEPVPPTQVVELDEEAKLEAGANYVVRVWGAVTGGDGGGAGETNQPLRVGCVSIFLRGLSQAQVEQVAAQLGVPLETNLVDTGLSAVELVRRINRGLVPDELPEVVVRGIFQNFASLFGGGVEGSDLPEEKKRVSGAEAADGRLGGTIRPGAGGIFNFEHGLPKRFEGRLSVVY